MMAEEFEAGDRINRLAGALCGLSKAELPFLEDGWRHNPRGVLCSIGGSGFRTLARPLTPPAVAIEDGAAVPHPSTDVEGGVVAGSGAAARATEQRFP